jgi:hypothetical protein
MLVENNQFLELPGKEMPAEKVQDAQPTTGANPGRKKYPFAH